jgi:D-serine deaminase-like pyridoxal phosphate-dependent protein
LVRVAVSEGASVSAAATWWTADEVRVDTSLKAFGPELVGRTVRDLAAAGTTVSGLATPVLTLDAAAVEHNIGVMAAFTAEHGVELAPHGKTTMSPALWHRQLDAGAWAITVATPWQLRVAAAAGVRRILHAGAMLAPADLGAVAGLLAGGDVDEVLVWADSADAVEVIAAGYPASGPPLSVLVDRGGPGSRTGARTLAAALDTARAIADAPHLRLAGVAAWEGSQRPVGDADLRDLIAALVRGLAETYRATADLGLLEPGAIVTCGGSNYPDIVVDRLEPLRDVGATVVIRSGCYLTHDDGEYAATSPLDPARTADGLRAAMHVWGQVVSRPEPELALLNLGKRDVGFDSGLPVPQRVRGREESGTGRALAGAQVTALNDQHAFLMLDPSSDLRVGEVVRCGISHPCTTFDKWAVVPVVADATSDDPVVIGAIRTVF